MTAAVGLPLTGVRRLRTHGLMLVVPVWLVGAAAVTLVAVVSALIGDHARLYVWDTVWYDHIAARGYYLDEGSVHDYDKGGAAFMPALPLLLRLGHEFGAGAVPTGVVVSFVALGVACVALSRYAGLDDDPQPGTTARRAMLCAALSPVGLWLFVGYTEALFLAVAVPALLAARRGRWAVAGVLASGSVLVRLTGLSVAFAVGVAWLVTLAEQPGARARMRAAASWPSLWVALPGVTYIGWQLALWRMTGRVDAQSWALRQVWQRHPDTPWGALVGTWQHIERYPHSALHMSMEAAAMLAGAIGVVWLARSRRWVELGYVGSSWLLLLCTNEFNSCLRALLVWFPLWLGVSRGLARHPAVTRVWFLVGAGLLLVSLYTFELGERFLG